MIAFISLYPSAENEKDGMVQRVVAVDKLLSLHQRCYLELSYRRHLRLQVLEPAPGVCVYRLNFFLHFLLMLKVLRAARFIYVHSVFWGIRIAPLYPFFRRRLVTDMHGIVPEEMELAGLKREALKYALVERLAVACSRRLIVVTDAMGIYLSGKYGRTLPCLTLPIFDPELLAGGDAESAAGRDPRLVIYAGGLQAWQNIDRMMHAIAANTDMNYLLLSGDLQGMQAALGQAESVRVQVRSVPRSEVGEYCRRATFGFVLRDDVAVNRVACPTKLIEYLGYGVIPIVFSPAIGDFEALGYSYVLFDDFVAGVLPDDATVRQMRRRNFDVFSRLRGRVEAGERALAELLPFVSVRV